MSALDVFWAAPPISRSLAAATLATSVLVHTKLLDFSAIMFYTPWILKFPPEIWRLFTPFCISSPGFGILMDTYFIYTYGSQLELGSPKFAHPADFLTYLVFVCTIILGLNAAVLGGVVFTTALTLAFAYSASQDQRGAKANFFVITIPAQWVPYAMLLMTFVMAGQQATLIQASGLFAAHLYDFLTRIWPTFGGGRNLVPTPAIFKRLFETSAAPNPGRTTASGPGPVPVRRAPAATGSSAGVLPESWRSRGSGHRLGGE